MSSLPSHSPLPARPQRPTPPLTIITLPLVVGIFAANAFTWLWFCPPVVCLSLAAVFLVWVLWAIKSSRHDAMWSRCGVGMASFFIGAALFQHHVATIPPDIDAPHPATYTLLIDKTPKATERSWLVDGRLTSGQYAGRRVRVRLATGPLRLNKKVYRSNLFVRATCWLFTPPSNRRSLWAIPASSTMPSSYAKTICRAAPFALVNNGD